MYVHTQTKHTNIYKKISTFVNLTEDTKSYIADMVVIEKNN